MIRTLREYNLGQPFQQMRCIPVALGDGGEDAQLFVHANTPCLDPWEESMSFPIDTLKLTLTSPDGRILWWRDLGRGVIPGIWFEPVLSFDLDGDGVDEIWLLGNTYPSRPFTFEHRVLERMDPRTGKVTGQWPWPLDLAREAMAHAYRFTLMGGYAHGEPVLICAQGTYTDMYLQGYGKDMTPRWTKYIAANEPGARASHVTPVLDINGDGVDELFWGERVLSVADGRELFCGDRESFHAHSDIVIPFVDPQSEKLYVYTCREGQEEDGVSRVVTYDERMNVVWRWPEGGHMHKGWVAAIGENRRYVAMAMSLALHATGGDIHHSKPIVYYFDAVTGEPLEWTLPYPGEQMMPIDLDGDGYHEFYITEGERKGLCIDRHGKELARIGGGQIRAGKVLDRNGQQLMLGYGEEGIVRIWGDDAAVPGPGDRFKGYHMAMQHMMASGYNHINGVQSCGM